MLRAVYNTQILVYDTRDIINEPFNYVPIVICALYKVTNLQRETLLDT